MNKSKSIYGNVIHEVKNLTESDTRYHRILSSTPIIPGRWPGVANEQALAEAIYATMDIGANCLTPNGTITTNVGRGPAFNGQKELKAWQALNQDNENGLEEVPNSAFRVWYGTWIDLNNNDVFVHGRPENHHYKTFRRLGSDAGINSYTLPESVPQIAINEVTKSPGLYPIDHNPTPDEGQMWLYNKGYDFKRERDNPDFKKFKALLIEFDHDKGNYIQIPLPQSTPLGMFDIDDKVHTHIHSLANRGSRHAVNRIEKYANHDIWLYYWMSKVFTNTNERVLIPFAGDGEMTLATLMNGSTPTTIELNELRHEINRDIIYEWERNFY